MAITAALVKDLRERTGAGMMDCKRALTETNGDMEAAIDLMRTSGAAKAAKKSGRVAAEGLVKVNISDDNKTATILEVNSETDFVTKGDDFINFVNTLGELALKTKPADIEEFLTQTLDNGDSLDKAREDIVAKVGENVSIRRVKTVTVDSGVIGAYKHGERIAVLAVLEGGDETLAKDIAMHVAATNPKVLSPDEIGQDLVDKEKEIWTEQLKNEGKPEEIMEKIMMGKEKKFREENALIKQAFVKDPEKTIEQLLSEASATVKEFVRFSI
jgi:elongation factor Ts